MEDVKQLLLRSYDSSLNEKEKRQLQDRLVQSEVFRKEKENLDNVRSKIAAFDADFSAGFTERLMQRIAGESGFAFLAVFRAFALPGVAAIILILLTVYFMDGSLYLNSLLGIDGYAPYLGMLSIF
ncbi:MAG: hypothetical protein IEMM0006_0744 [bacterium]|nr:MAG: hypothetical protein IEMM0006_0744 [bacterium]